MTSNPDRAFVGSIPQIYERYLVPLIFAPYAEDLAKRAAALRPASVLEIAAGTGVVARALARLLPLTTAIVATDLNQHMLDQAVSIGAVRDIDWRQADAMQLPFADASFDVVVCQFGVMFFPDRVRAMAEARRVLRPGGAFVFNVWDRIAYNDFANVVTTALAQFFPGDPPLFMARTPHGYHDPLTIARDIASAGFAASPAFDVVTERSVADSPRHAAIAFCQGTPLRSEIDARDGTQLEAATDAAETAITARFGSGRVEGNMQALIARVLR